MSKYSQFALVLSLGLPILLPVIGYFYDRVGAGRLIVAGAIITVLAQILASAFYAADLPFMLIAIAHTLCLAALSYAFLYAALVIKRNDHNLLQLICVVWIVATVLRLPFGFVLEFSAALGRSANVLDIASVVLALGCLACAVLLRRDLRQSDKDIDAVDRVGTQRGLEFTRNYWWLVVVAVLAGIAATGIKLQFPLVVLGQSYSFEQAAFLRLVPGGTEFFGVLCVAWLSTRLNYVWLLSAILVLLSVGIFAFAILPDIYSGAIFGGVLIGAFSAPLILIAFGIVGYIVSPERMGLAFGLILSTMLIGNFAGIKLASMTNGLIGIEMKLGLAMFGAIAIVAAICSLHVGHTKHDKELT